MIFQTGVHSRCSLSGEVSGKLLKLNCNYISNFRGTAQQAAGHQHVGR
jgi:hypothetical protein